MPSARRWLSWLPSLSLDLVRRLWRRSKIALILCYNSAIGPEEQDVHLCIELEPKNILPVSAGKQMRRCFLIIIDVSSSMRSEHRLECAQRAACEAIRHIRAEDSFVVIAFARDAEVVYRGASLSAAGGGVQWDTRLAEAVEAIGRLRSSYGTNIGSALHMAFREFYDSHAEEGQGLLLSDGENNAGNFESDLAFLKEGRKLGKVLSIACRRIGRGTRIDYLRRICDTTFGGVVRVVDHVTELNAEFTQWIGAIYSTTINNLRLIIELEPGVSLTQVLQVTPSVIPLTEYMKEDRGELVVQLGSIDNTKRRFYFKLSIGKKELIRGRPSRLALVNVSYRAEGRYRQDPMWGTIVAPLAVLVRFDPDKESPNLPEEVEASRDRIDYLDSVKLGLDAWEQGDDASAARYLGSAVRIAHKWGDSEQLERLAGLTEIIDAETGQVEMRPRGEIDEVSMELDAGASETDFVKRPPPDDLTMA